MENNFSAFCDSFTKVKYLKIRESSLESKSIKRKIYNAIFNEKINKTRIRAVITIILKFN